MAHFAADVQEDADRAQHQVGVRQGRFAAGRAGRAEGIGGAVVMADLGQARELEQHRQRQQRRGQRQVRALHRGRLVGVISRLRGGRQLGQVARIEHDARQDQQAADGGGHRGAEGIEGLGQGQARGRGARVAQRRHVGVGRHLQDGDAAGQDEEGQQEQAVATVRGWIEHRAAGGGDHQAGHGAVLVADLLDQHAGRERDDEVGAEEAELHQHRLHIGERVHRFQVRNEHVVQGGQQTPHEEQDGDDDERAGVTGARVVRGRDDAGG